MVRSLGFSCSLLIPSGREAASTVSFIPSFPPDSATFPTTVLAPHQRIVNNKLRFSQKPFKSLFFLIVRTLRAFKIILTQYEIQTMFFWTEFIYLLNKVLPPRQRPPKKITPPPGGWGRFCDPIMFPLFKGKSTINKGIKNSLLIMYLPPGGG